MAPSKRKEEKANLSVEDALESMESGTVQGRTDGVSELLKILKHNHKSPQLEVLEDEAYHKICETLFKVAYEEKRTYLSNKAATTKVRAETVLTSCANALRITVKAGAKKLKAKTRTAIIEHVTQLVPVTSDEYCAVWGQIYLKVLGALFEHEPYMEQIHEYDWVTAVQFCVQGLKRHGAISAEKMSSNSRNAILVGSNSSSRASGSRISIRSGGDHSSSSITRINAEELMQSLLLLLSPPNAPVLEQAENIMEGIIHFLQCYGSTVTPIHQVSFAALNFMISAASTDEIHLTEAVAVQVIPIICTLWSSKNASQSSMLSSARDEMLITILSLRLHMQHLLGSKRNDFEHVLEELDSVLRNDYSKRSERDQLQVDDLDMALFSRLVPCLTVLNVGDVQLRQHNHRAERKWAILEVLSMLESMLHFNRKNPIAIPQNFDDTCDSAHPRKRRRVAQQFEELLNRIDSVDEGEKLLALQTMLFILPTSSLNEQDVNDLLERLSPSITEKRNSIGSWAMLCIACCASGIAGITNRIAWKRLWHTVARLITSPTTCRPACHLLHSALANELVSYQDIAEDVNAIITVTEISAPAILCDTSILLMIHLLHIRNMQVPGGSSTACQQVVHWLSARWNPVEKYFAARCAIDIHPIDIINLLRVCIDLPLLQTPSNRNNTYGIIGQAWIQLSRRDESDRYVLLLSNCVRRHLKCLECDTKISGLHTSTRFPNKLSYLQPMRSLIIELFLPRFELLVQDWESHNSDQLAQVSTDTLRCAASTCVMGCLMLSLLTDPLLPLLQEIRTLVQQLAKFVTETMSDKRHAESLIEAVLLAIEPYLPSKGPSEQSNLALQNQDLSLFFIAIAEKLEKSTLAGVSTDEDDDPMDLDDMFHDIQNTRSRLETSRNSTLRREIAMSVSINAFCSVTSAKLVLLSKMPQQFDGTVDGISKFIRYFVRLAPFETLLCRRMIQDIFQTDLTIDIADASELLEYVGQLLTPEYDCCEVALGLCLDILMGLMPIWIRAEEVEVSDKAFDLYKWFICVVVPKRRPSVNVQIRICELLFKLIAMQSSYGEEQGLPSVRSSILDILQRGPLQVKFHVGKNIPDLFSLFVLQAHNEILNDILESLPLDPNWIEGNAFRLHILSKLASRWHTLLRLCVYYMLEVSGTIPDSCGHASRCLAEISTVLHLANAQELFELFSSQLLFTWLALKPIEQLPYQVFGYDSLQDLLQKNQNEVVGLMIMRNQDVQLSDIAKILSVSEEQLLEDSFTKIMAYSIAYDISIPRSDDEYITGEARLRKRLGKEKFFQHVNTHFADIIALFFCLIDQEEHIEKTFIKSTNLLYAANILREIKSFSSLNSNLPPDQQPAFKAKYLTDQIDHLCGRTEFELSNLYSPAIVVFIARKLLNSVKQALGSSHTCSVLRKLRILVALAGPTVLGGYPLEMLLQSLRPFIIDAACADDAIGIIQYLLARGTVHLSESPSFAAGFALSMLSSLKVFLESNPAGTTQESQFRSTLTKAQKFHAWLGLYLTKYKSPILIEESVTLFQTIVQSAYEVRSVGNAVIETPESRLLLAILEDEKSNTHLLNKPSRELAFGLLYSNFERPESFRTDILGSDHQATSHAMTLWKLCQNGRSHTQFCVWAATVLGRAFLATGNIHQDLLRESDLRTTMELASLSSNSTSKASILRLIQLETLHEDHGRAGRAETALRVIISKVNDTDAAACEDGLSHTLLTASVWKPYHVPPSDFLSSHNVKSSDPYSPHEFTNSSWLQNLTTSLVRSVPSDVILFSLQPLLLTAGRFTEEAFPFILHLILFLQFDGPQLARRQMSKSLQAWLANEQIAARNNLKLLVNALLYLRTQPLPRESSAADRLHWLDVDYSQAAEASVRCGMFKTALLFTEISLSEVSRSSRRSSASNTDNSSHVLLTIFQNVDDPDIFYGLNQVHSLKTVLSRLEYENDGSKSLAFRGAQYDSHLRLKGISSTIDLQALVKSLGTLKLDGLSYSSLQFQQSRGMDADSTISMYHVARKLEQWDLPVPSASDIDWVSIYKTFREINGAMNRSSMICAIEDGLSSTISTLVHGRPHASAIRTSLQSLAVFVEMDEVLSGSNSEHFEEMLLRFNDRSDWMRTGRWEDVSEILSCRETLLSSLSQKAPLREIINVNASDARLVEVQTTLLSAKLTRAHGALQESLQSATHLSGLVEPCVQLGLNIEAAAHIEAASALWDQGEMASSIGILKSLEHSSSMKKQTIAIAKSDLLAKIAFQVSEARLEKPDRIIEKYLVPALKELKGKAKGSEAGKVFHEFAVFCDHQFQDPNGLEDLERLRRLKEMKESEVRDLARMTKTAATPDLKSRYHSHFIKAKQWLQLDSEEYRRLSSGRDELLRQSLENYLLSLVASDEHNNDALRFSALWFEHAEEEIANESVAKHLNSVPSRKFASLTNQLTSRLLDSSVHFQDLLFSLVLRVCTDHPYHGMYQIWAGTKNKVSSKDEAAVSRNAATARVASQLERSQKSAKVWKAISNISRVYCQFAAERDETRFKAGQRIALKDSIAGSILNNMLPRFPIAPPTMHVEIASDLNYSNLPVMFKIAPQISIASGVSAPKIITVVADNGAKHKQLVKGGSDDLRQDAIMEQVFSQVSELLRANTATRQRNLGIRTYKVLPLSSNAGIIEFVADTIPLHEYLMPAHERYYPKDLKGSACRKQISDVQTQKLEVRIKTYRQVADQFHPVMRYFLLEKFYDPDDWFTRRVAYTRSTAAISMLGHVLGLGDRHGHNILLDEKTGEVVHIDLGVAFETGRVLPVPELVPFRLTRDIQDGMGTTKTEGIYRRCCEFTLEALRKEAYSIMTILDVLRYDPLYNWSISPVRLAKLQDAHSAAPPMSTAGDTTNGKTREAINEPSEADRALTVVRKKLSKTLSVTATVNDLINQASDERNLAVLYAGWAAYA